MRILLLSMLLAVLIPVAAIAQASAPKVDAKAQEVLKLARKAIGSEDKLKALQSLSANGTRRVSMGQMNMEGELEVDLLMPDKIRLSSGMTTPAGDIISIQAINGDKVWTDMIRPIGGGGPGGGGGGFRGGGVMGGGMDQAKADILRLSLGLLLTTPSAFPLEYTYAGEAQAPDGKAEVVDVKGAGTFAARLFFDQSSHHLLMLSYKGKDFRQMMRNGGRQGGPGAGGQGGGQGRPPGMLSREELEKLPAEERAKKEAEMKAARDKRDAEMRETMAKLPDVDYQWNFSDYKSVSGINLPHHITKGVGGDTNEEWDISKYKLNQPIKADKFEKKEKDKSPGSN